MTTSAGYFYQILSQPHALSWPTSQRPANQSLHTRVDISHIISPCPLPCSRSFRTGPRTSRGKGILLPRCHRCTPSPDPCIVRPMGWRPKGRRGSHFQYRIANGESNRLSHRKNYFTRSTMNDGQSPWHQQIAKLSHVKLSHKEHHRSIIRQFFGHLVTFVLPN